MTVITVIANLCAKTQSEIALSRTAPAGRGVPTMWKVNTISHLNRLFQTGLISSSFKCPRYTFEYNFFFGFFFTNFWRKVVSPLNWDDRLWAAVKSFTVQDQLWFQVGSNGESHVKSRKGDLTMIFAAKVCEATCKCTKRVVKVDWMQGLSAIPSSNPGKENSATERKPLQKQFSVK